MARDWILLLMPSSLASVMVTVAVFIPIMLIVQFTVTWFSKYRRNNKIPGPPGRWVSGRTHMEALAADERYRDAQILMRLYPRIYKIWIYSKLIVYVLHPDTVKMLLMKADPKPRNWGSPYRHGEAWLGDGLLLSYGAKWARNRRLLSPAFHFDILKPYFAIYNRNADLWLENIQKQSDAGSSFDITEINSLCTLDTVLQCAFSFNSDCQVDRENNEYVRSVRKLTDSWDHRNRHPFDWADFLFNRTQRGKEFNRLCDYVHGIAEDVIGKRRNTLSAGVTEKKKYLDFLDILLTAKDADGHGLSAQDIRNEVDTFLFEGHDTTSSGISWLMYCLAVHQDWQKKIQDEVDDLLSGKENSDVEWSDLNHLELLSMFLKETFRIYPPVPFIGRAIPEDITVDGYTIPKDTTVIIHILSLHTNPTVWDDPQKFDPYRFTQENSAKRDSFAYLPFSAGPRNCIGQHFALHELKVLVARLVRRFHLTVDPDHKVRRKFAAVYSTEDGIKLHAKRR